MGSKLAEATATFGLLHFCPYPERGDRVCVGIWVDDGRRMTLAYDRRLHQLHCIAPELDLNLVRMLLDDLDQALRDSNSSERHNILRQHAPQLVSTEPRKLLVPFTPEVRQQLLNAFLLPSREASRTHEQPTAAAKYLHDPSAQRLREFVRSFIQIKDVRVLENPTPYTLFNITSRIRTPSVALAVERPNKLVLLDGVDLNVLTPKRAVSRVNSIVYAFWQFGRLTQNTLFSRDRLQRVGIILNGVSTIDRALIEAHDYAIDRFRTEADLTVDATTDDGRAQLAATLNE